MQTSSDVVRTLMMHRRHDICGLRERVDARFQPLRGQGIESHSCWAMSAGLIPLSMAWARSTARSQPSLRVPGVGRSRCLVGLLVSSHLENPLGGKNLLGARGPQITADDRSSSPRCLSLSLPPVQSFDKAWVVRVRTGSVTRTDPRRSRQRPRGCPFGSPYWKTDPNPHTQPLDFLLQAPGKNFEVCSRIGGFTSIYGWIYRFTPVPQNQVPLSPFESSLRRGCRLSSFLEHPLIRGLAY